MIQQVDPRRVDPSLGPPGIRQAPQDAIDHWGQWHGRRHYSLEVVQHPLRARMCGFGDKDRRPLAPAAVARMVVRKEDNSIVDVDDVDSSFFLVAVDLWSADGKVDRNLVLHPSSDRYVPPHPAKPKRRGGSTSTSQPRSSGNQTPVMANATTGHYRQTDQSGPITPINPYSSATNPSYYSPNTPYPPPPPQYNNSSAPETPTWGYASQQDSQADRGGAYPPPALPSIHTFGREPWQTGPAAPSPNTSTPTGSTDPTTSHAYRGYDGTSSFQSTDHSQVDPALRGPDSDGREATSSTWPGQDSGSAFPSASSYAPPPPPFYSSTYPPAMHGSVPPGGPVPRHTYTRTLVGPLTANAARLLDEHRKPGIFFLFQDLSVRTEGSFRLRLRLMNVGAPPAPEAGATRVHQDVSPVLAQTFTDSFVVYSAKRFPGVPDTTALSIAFGNQGQKLPLRNRHGSGKRVRQDDSGSEEDSDGA